MKRNSCFIYLFVLLSLNLGAESIQTASFETDEGYVEGPLDGQNSWSSMEWTVASGGLAAGVVGPNAQHVQLAGPATAGQRAYVPLPVSQNGTVYARIDFRYEGSYDFADFFWAALSAGDGSGDNASLGVVLRAAQPNSVQFYGRSTSSSGTKTNSAGYFTHIYNTTYTLVLQADKSGGGPTDPYDRIRIYVNPDLSVGSVEPASPTAEVTASIGSASLNGLFFRIGDAGSLDTGERILIDSINSATSWADLTREYEEQNIIGSPAQTDIDSVRIGAASAPDFDHDGVSDTAERAFGRNIQGIDEPAAVIHSLQPHSTYVDLTYDRLDDPAPYAISVESGATLADWDTAGIDQESALSVAPDGRARVTARIPRQSGSPVFARLSVRDSRLMEELDQAAIADFFAMTLSWWSQYVNAAGTKDTYGATTTWDYEWVMRMLVPMAAWLSQPGRPESVSWNGITVNVADALRDALVNGTDPAHPDRWLYAANKGDQIIVEAPQVAYALWLLHQASLDRAPGGLVWDSFSSAQLSNMQAFLNATADPAWSYYNNWNLFIVLNHEARKRLQLAGVTEFDSYSQTAIDNRLSDVQGFHKGGGWYADHESDSVFDDYLPWALLPDQMVTFMMGHSDSQVETVIPNTGGRGRSQILEDASSWLNDHIRMFDAFGANPEYGRSNTYKFARLRAIVTAYVIDRFYNTPDGWNLGFSVLPTEIGPGGLRRLVRLHLNHYLENGILNPTTGELRNGQTPDSSSQTLEPYTHDGSRFWALFPIATLLLLPEDDPLWSTPESALPAETHAYESWFQAPGLLVRNAPGAGHLELFNARAERPSWTNTSYTPKYNKYAYSTHFGYGTPSGTRLDQSISIGGSFRDNPASGDYYLPEDRLPDEPGVIRTTHTQNGATVKTLIFLKDDLQVRVNQITGASGKSVEEAGYPLGHDPGETFPPPISGPDWIYLESSEGALLTARLHGFTSLALDSGTDDHSRKAGWRLPYARLDSSGATQNTAILLVARRESFHPEAVSSLGQSVSFDNTTVTVNWSDGASTTAEFQ